MNILKRNIFFSASLLCLLGAASCSNNEVDAPDTNIPDTGATYQLGITFNLESDGVSTRGTNGYDGANTGVIGTGSMVDYLKFAIYDSAGNLLTRFAKEENSSLVLNGKTVTAGPGQNILKWEGEYLTIYLSSLNEGEYKIVCWAQSSKCDAYNTTDLSDVKVSYADAVSNDESRDAFCASQSIYVDADGESTVILRRPFSQINVGTTGADYKVSAHTPGGDYYTYNKIEIKGAADRLDVLNGKASVSDEAKNNVALFKWSVIPAYINSELPVKGEEPADDTKNPFLYGEGEQYLLIDLDGDNEFKPFLTNYNTIKKDDAGKVTYLTETFKYLSMNYVLVPFSSDNSVSNATTLTEIKVYFSNNLKGEEISAANTSFAINNLPVCKNWRTNILGGLYAKNYIPGEPGDPNDPNNPGNPDDPNNPGGDPLPDPSEDPDPDPSSLFNGVKCMIQVTPAYFGEYNIPELNEYQTK